MESPTLLHLSHVTVDLVREVVTDADGTAINLTTREAALLRYLAARPGEAVGRDELLTEVWGYSDDVNSRATDTHVRRLREKIEADPARPAHLITVFGHGYRFVPRSEMKETALPAVHTERIRIGDLVFDPVRHTVRVDGVTTRLTATEAGIVSFMLDRPGRTVSRRELLRNVWGRRTTRPTRAVDKAIQRLRAKIETDPSHPTLLVTVRGRGFQLRPTPASVEDVTGAVALVVTDVENNALLWAKHPTAMSRAVEIESAYFRRLVAQHGGQQLMQDGAGFRFAFRQVRDALDWCLAALDGLDQEPWPEALLASEPARRSRAAIEDGLLTCPPFRFALHWGELVQTPGPVAGNKRYTGPAIEAAKALVRLGRGGRLVASEPAWRLLPTDTREALDTRRLDGAGWLVTPSTHQPPRLVGLPADSSSFLGRSEELEALRGTVGAMSGGFVSILGAPGVGKTRLASGYARRYPADHDSVVWCELAGARTRDDMVHALARVLGLTLGRARDPAARVGIALASRGRALVVLDNFEQLVPDGNAVLSGWVEAAPDARFLVTSRHRLGVPGEEVIALEPMTHTEATALFRDRARAVAPRLSIANDDPAVARLVDSLDRLPLAIELAAARADILSPQAMVDRLEDRLALLRRSRAPADTRHASLYDAVAHSWALLDATERSALAQLSVFVGGFSVDAAEEVVVLPDATSVVDVLQALRHKSLVRSWRPDAKRDVRLGVYESMRSFAHAQLGDAEREAVLRRHVTWFAEYGSLDYLESIRRHGGMERRTELAAELDNIVAATRRATALGDARGAAACACAAVEVIRTAGPLSAAVDLVDPVLELELSPPSRVAALYARARCCRTDRARSRQLEADLAEAMELARRHDLGHMHLELLKLEALRHIDARDGQEAAACGAVAELARRMDNHGLADFNEGRRAQYSGEAHRSRAEALYLRAISAFRADGNELALANAYNKLGEIRWAQGRPSEARAAWEQAAAIYRTWEAWIPYMARLNALSYLARERGDLETFYPLNAQIIDQGRHHAPPALIGDASLERAHVLTLDERLDEAAVLFDEAEGLVRTHASRHSLAYLLLRRAEHHLATGDLERAASLSEASREVWEELGMTASAALARALRGEVALAAGDTATARARVSLAEAQGRTAPGNDLAVVLLRRALVDVAEGECSAAQEALAEARDLAARMDAGPRSETGRYIARVERALTDVQPEK